MQSSFITRVCDSIRAHNARLNRFDVLRCNSVSENDTYFFLNHKAICKFTNSHKLNARHVFSLSNSNSQVLLFVPLHVLRIPLPVQRTIQLIGFVDIVSIHSGKALLLYAYVCCPPPTYISYLNEAHILHSPTHLMNIHPIPSFSNTGKTHV